MSAPRAALLLLAAALGVTCARTPATSGLDLSLVSESDLERSSREFGNALAGRVGLVEMHDIGSLVRRVGRKVAARSHEPERHFTFEILDAPTPNAFALPDGTVFVTRGMVALVNNEHELALLLGHEIAHVTARHSRAQMTRESLLRGVSLLGTPLLAGAGLGNLLVGVVQPTYSRDQEREADALGRDYAVGAGFDGGCGAELLRVMARLSKLDDEAPDPARWSATHPAPLERYAQLRADPATGTCAGDYLERLQGLEMPDVFSAEDGTVWVPRLQLRVAAGPPEQEFEIDSDRRVTLARLEDFPSPIELRLFPEGAGIDDARKMARQWPEAGGRNGPRRLLYDETPLGTSAGVRLAIWESVRGTARVSCYRWLDLDGHLYLARTEVPDDAWQQASDALDALALRFRSTGAPAPRVSSVIVGPVDSLVSLSRDQGVWSPEELSVYNGLEAAAEPSAGTRLKILSRPETP